MTGRAKTDLRHVAAQESAAPNSRFNWPRAVGAIILSVVVNAVCPYLIYRVLEPRYPAGSLVPLLASTVFPLFGLVLGAVRRRMLDAIALISLVEIAIGIAVTVAARDIRLALLARALQGTLTGLFVVATAAVGRPLLFYVARQFVMASSPQAASGFAAAQARDGGTTFRRLTVAWGIGTILVSVVNILLAATIAPADYLLASPILSIATNAILIAWTIRYASRRLGQRAV